MGRERRQSLSQTLITIVTLIYIGVAVSEGLKGNLPMTIIFAGYSFANAGFLMGVK